MKINGFIAAAVLLLAVMGMVSCNSLHKQNDARSIASTSAIFMANLSASAGVFANESPARKLTSEQIRKLSSTAKLPITQAEVLIDNDASFDAKLSAIKNAKKEIRLVYYIYSDDDSSSLFTQELIKKAKAGVKVKMLVDVITNYKYIDLFSMMIKEGNGNIQVHFYNFPSNKIIADAKYMTLPCPKVDKPAANTCSLYKNKIMAQTATEKTNTFSRLFLAGLYGRSAAAIKVSLGLGALINPEDYKSKQPSEEDAAKLLEFFKLVFDAKFKNDIKAMVKVKLAMIAHADDLNPVMNELTGRLPMTMDTSHAQEWDHFTDYVHHKLLVVDGQEFQLGGRNIEDSYHMKSRLGDKGKYIFMDTDFHARTTPGGAREIEVSYDKMFNFKQMVVDLKTLKAIMPFDYVANSQALGMAAAACMQDAQAGKVKLDQLGSCIDSLIVKMPSYLNESARIAQLNSNMNIASANYTKNYVQAGKKNATDNWKQQSTYSLSADDLSPADIQSSEIYYIENTPYDVDGKKQLRKIGARIGQEARYNKNIHALWYRGLENSCRVSREEQRDVRVVLHTAYLFMPSGLMHQFSKMMNGDYGDCSRVQITLLTNSFQTTDLNVINVFARYQMVELFKHYAGLVANEKLYLEKNKGKVFKRWYPRLEYFEYNASNLGTGVSLHTKLSILGDDAIIGSANADTRSYYMDTNNAVFVRNAKEFIRDYNKFIDGITQDKNKSSEWTQKFAAYTPEMLQMENRMILGAMLKRWDKKGRVDAKKKAEILETLDKMGAKVTNATQEILNFRKEFDKANGSSQERVIENQLNKIANDFDDFFKVL